MNKPTVNGKYLPPPGCDFFQALRQSPNNKAAFHVTLIKRMSSGRCKNILYIIIFLSIKHLAIHKLFHVMYIVHIRTIVNGAFVVYILYIPIKCEQEGRQTIVENIKMEKKYICI